MPHTTQLTTVLAECGAYVDDAAMFPEQFKPGVVKRHQRQYVTAQKVVAELVEAANRLQEQLPKGQSLRAYFANAELVALRKALADASDLDR